MSMPQTIRTHPLARHLEPCRATMDRLRAQGMPLMEAKAAAKNEALYRDLLDLEFSNEPELTRLDKLIEMIRDSVERAPV